MLAGSAIVSTILTINHQVKIYRIAPLASEKSIRYRMRLLYTGDPGTAFVYL